MGPKKNSETPTKNDPVVSNETESENTIALQNLTTQMAAQNAQMMTFFKDMSSRLDAMEHRFDQQFEQQREESKSASSSLESIPDSAGKGITKDKEHLIFDNSKQTVENVNNQYQSPVKFIDNDEEDPTQIRQYLNMITQSALMMNVEEHMSGTIEYIPDNGGSLPHSTITILQPGAKKVFISNGNIGKLLSIAAILYTILTKSLKNDDALMMIADGGHTDGKGPWDNMQPFIMIHNLVERFGKGDVSSKVDAYDELSLIKQGESPDIVYVSKFNAIVKRQNQLNQPIPDDLILFYLLKNSSFQDFYEFIEEFIKNDRDKSWSSFIKKQMARDKAAIKNVDRKRRNTGEIEGTPVYSIKSSNRSNQLSPSTNSTVYGIRSENYLQIGQTFQAGHCYNCFATNHTVTVCNRPCSKCAHRDPSQPLHAARDCPKIRSSVSKPEVKVSTTQPQKSSNCTTPVFGSPEHEKYIRKQIKTQLVHQILAGEEISASSSDSDGAHPVNYIHARNWNGELSEDDIA